MTGCAGTHALAHHVDHVISCRRTVRCIGPANAETVAKQCIGGVLLYTNGRPQILPAYLRVILTEVHDIAFGIVAEVIPLFPADPCPGSVDMVQQGFRRHLRVYQSVDRAAVLAWPRCATAGSIAAVVHGFPLFAERVILLWADVATIP